MADSILKLKVDSAEYDSKLKKASDGITRYIEGCRKVGGTLEVVEKDTLDYVKALGQMSTTSRTARGTLSEMTKTFTDLSYQYSKLTAQEKESPFGQALNASLGELKTRTTETKEQLDSISQSLNNVPQPKGFQSIVSTMGSMSMAMQGVYNGISTLSSSVSEMTEAFGVQEEAELKLQTVMRQRMKASDSDVESIFKLASAQQQLGVIGDEVQLAGAQQVATFLNEKKSIETLLPAMNNLAVQRKGLNVTSEDMVNIGNLVGKVMQGQVSALTRVGITFTDAQKQVLKYGNEQERAAMLAQVITDNVGNMNQVLAKTDAGKAKQMANNFGDMQEEIGKALVKWEPFIKSFSQIGMIAMGIGQVVNAVTGVTKSIAALTATTAISSLNTRLATSIVNGFSTALGISAVSATASATAIKGVTWAIRGLEIATGIGVAIAAISLAVEALGTHLTSTGNSASDASRKIENLSAAEKQHAAAAAEAQRVAERNKTANETVSSSVSGLVGKYQTLQTQWKALKTDAEKTKWIEKNQSAFSELGMSVGGVNDAYNYFVKNSSRVIAALKAIAEADAYQDLYKEAIKKREQAGRNKNVANGGYYTVHHAGRVNEGSLPSDFVEGRDYSVTTVNHGPQGTERVAWISQSQANAWNRREQRNARQRWNDYYNPLNDNVNYYGGRMIASQQEVFRTAGLAGINPNGGSSFTPQHFGTSGHGGTGHGGGGNNNNDANRTELQKNNDAIDALTQQYVKLAEARQNAADAGKDDKTLAAYDNQLASINSQIVELNKRNDLLKKYEAEASAPRLKFDVTAIPKIDVKQYEEEVKQQQEKERASFSDLTDSNIDSFISSLQNKLKNANFGTVAGQNLKSGIEDQLKDINVFKNVLDVAQTEGIDLSGIDMSQIWDELLDPKNADAAIDTFIDYVKQKFKDKTGQDLNLDSSGKKQSKDKDDDKNGKGETSVMGGIDKLNNSMSSIVGGVQGLGINVPQGIQNVINGISSITSIINGIYGVVTAIEAISTASSFWPFHNGGMAHAATGYKVPGNHFSGDLVPAMLNSGELILNQAQQGNLASQLEDQRQDYMPSRPYVSGEEIYLGLTAFLKRRGRGELVTSNTRH